MLHFKANKLAGNAVQYSPFIDNRLLLGAAANFGIVGNGKLFVLDISPNQQINAIASFDTQDSIFSAVFSELNENQLIAGTGDGSIQLFDALRPHPLVVFKEHTREVFGLSWGLQNKHRFASCSWDGTIKLWDANGAPKSLVTLTNPPSQNNIVYEVKFAPNDFLATANANGTSSIYDLRLNRSQLELRGGGECLTVDFNKYNQLVSTGSSDGTVRIFDLRNVSAPVAELRGHSLAVKSVKWSPHSADQLLSASYDMSLLVWNTGKPVNRFSLHTEFVADCDWSLWGRGWVASTGWDGFVYVWDVQRPQR